MANEPWRDLSYVAPGAALPPPPPPLTISADQLGSNAQHVRDHLAEFQEARKKTLMRDFDNMEVYQVTDQNFIVVNYRTLSDTKGRYEVDMSELVCNCRDSFYTYQEEGTGVFCKHVLMVGLWLKSHHDNKEDGHGNQNTSV